MNMCAVHDVLDRFYNRRPVVKVPNLFELDRSWMREIEGNGYV